MMDNTVNTPMTILTAIDRIRTLEAACEGMAEALERANLMLSVTRAFIAANGLHEFTAEYDEATCDGYCIIDDCNAASENCDIALDRYRALKEAAK